MNIIDKAVLSPSAVKRWHKKADEMAEKIKSSVDPILIPDEQMEEQGDGSAIIFVDLPGQRVSMRVEPHEWSWMN